MQYGFALPRVRCTACLTACQWVNFPDSTTHRWERESQLAWSAYWARRCIWSPRGCPWKRHRAVWAHSKTGLTPSDRATRTTPQQELQTNTRSHRAAVSEMLVTEEEEEEKKPTTITITATACKQLHAFWSCKTNCSGFQLFINASRLCSVLSFQALLWLCFEKKIISLAVGSKVVYRRPFKIDSK